MKTRDEGQVPKMSNLIDELKSVPGRTSGDYFHPEQQPKIGGWLILIAIGLVINLLQDLNASLQVLKFFDAPVWTRLTDPTSPAFHPNWKSAIIYQVFAVSLFMIFSVSAVILFFGRRRVFPTFFIVMVPIMFALSFVGHYLWGQIPVVANTGTHTRMTLVLILNFIALHIWIPYFLVSKRVQRTFIC